MGWRATKAFGALEPLRDGAGTAAEIADEGSSGALDCWWLDMFVAACFPDPDPLVAVCRSVRRRAAILESEGRPSRVCR